MINNNSQLIQDLANRFKVKGSPAKDQDLKNLVENLKKIGTSNVSIPQDLKKIWKLASEWHLIEDHYDVFGFNIYSPDKIIQRTFEVMGDEELKKEWASEHGENSAGGQDWFCLAGFTEFDYVFVNFNEKSSLFGSTRHITNNTNRDKEASKAPFYNFIEYAKQKCDEFVQEQEEEEE